MKNSHLWQPTKFIRTPRGLRASRDITRVARCSRLVGDRLARACEGALQTHARGRLLDLGCGHVPLYETYKERVSENICVDWENTLHVNPHLDYILDLTQPLPLERASFDTVLLTDVLEHIPEPSGLVSEISRLLRPAGKLILTVPFLYWLHEEPHDFYRYTRFALERFCKLNELQVLELNAYGGLPEVFFDLAAKCADSLPRPVGSVLTPVCTFTSRLCSFAPVRKLSSWTSYSFPLGYLLVAQKKIS